MLQFDLEDDEVSADDIGWPCPILEVHRVPPLINEPPLAVKNDGLPDTESEDSSDGMPESIATLTFPCLSSLTHGDWTTVRPDNALMPYSIDREGIFYPGASDRIVRIDLGFTGYQGDDVNPPITVLFSTSSLLRHFTSSDPLPPRIRWNVWSSGVCIGPTKRYRFIHGNTGPHTLVTTAIEPWSEVEYDETDSDDINEEEDDDELGYETRRNTSGPGRIRIRDYHQRRVSRPVHSSTDPTVALSAGELKSYLNEDWVSEAQPADEYEENESTDIWEGVRPTLPVKTNSWKFMSTERDPPPELKGKAGGKYLLLDDGLVYVEASRMFIALYHDIDSHANVGTSRQSYCARLYLLIPISCMPSNLRLCTLHNLISVCVDGRCGLPTGVRPSQTARLRSLLHVRMK